MSTPASRVLAPPCLKKRERKPFTPSTFLVMSPVAVPLEPDALEGVRRAAVCPQCHLAKARRRRPRHGDAIEANSNRTNAKH